MQDSWLGLLDHVLCPARPDLERCLDARARHVALRCARQAERSRAVALCVEQIDAARRAVFAADDGVVGARMTELERQWRRLSHADPEAGLMDLWVRLVSPASSDRKRWRDSAASDWLEALVALAADEANVIAAEAAAVRFGELLSHHGVTVGTRVRWCFGAGQGRALLDSLAPALGFATQQCTERERSAILERAEREQQRIRLAAIARFADRPILAEELGLAAYVEFVWRAARLDDSQNPVAPLRSLWKTGYAVFALDGSALTLEIPPLGVQ
jgi:hypothetical protein